MIRTIIEAILLTRFDILLTSSRGLPSTTEQLQHDSWGMPRRGHFLVYYDTREKHPLDIYVPIGGLLLTRVE